MTAAVLLVAGFGLLLGSSAPTISCVWQQLCSSVASLQATRCGEMVIDAQKARLSDLLDVRVHWIAKECPQTGLQVTVVLPGKGYRFSMPGMEPRIQPTLCDQMPDECHGGLV